MRSNCRHVLKCLIYFATVLSPAILTIAAHCEKLVPTVMGSQGYINRTPLTSHATKSFNSVGASTMLAYVSSHPFWNGRPVSIVGIRDNLGNNWKPLVEPTAWDGSSATLLSAIYYVNAPISSEEHIVSAHLTNPAPLVLHVFAVVGSDISSTPSHSPINSLRAGSKSFDAIGEPISVQDHTLLLAWTKNESTATARTMDEYRLDQQSTSFLWGEYKTVSKAGSYRSHFHYDSAIGYQTAVIALEGTTKPIASSQAISTHRGKPISLTLQTLLTNGNQLAPTVIDGPEHGILSGAPPQVTYTPQPDYIGDDAFTFKASDGHAETNVATIHISVQPKTLNDLLHEHAMKIVFFTMIWMAIASIALPNERRARFLQAAQQRNEQG